MTPLWARMLVFKAWENNEITEKCAHYFDELILEYSKKRCLHVGQYELSSIEEVLENIGKLGLNSNNFDLNHYMNKIHFKNGYAEPLHHKTDVYLFEIINVEVENIDIMIYHKSFQEPFDAIEMSNLESYYDRLRAKRIINNPDTIDSINIKFANYKAMLETYGQKDELYDKIRSVN